MSNTCHTFNGTVRATTYAAALIELDNGDEAWFPVSVCPDLEGCERGDEVEFECPEWLAEEKDLA
jgi:hypothetical protein